MVCRILDAYGTLVSEHGVQDGRRLVRPPPRCSATRHSPTQPHVTLRPLCLSTPAALSHAHAGVDYGSRNVLADPAIREGVKAYTGWPTIPQARFLGASLFFWARPHASPFTPRSATQPLMARPTKKKHAFPTGIFPVGRRVLRLPGRRRHPHGHAQRGRAGRGADGQGGGRRRRRGRGARARPRVQALRKGDVRPVVGPGGRALAADGT
jgi:hypothetical protein